MKWGLLTVVSLVVLFVVVSVFIARRDRPKSFTYLFENTSIKFPISVREAMKRYNTLPHRYALAEADFLGQNACQLKKSSNAVSKIFYVDRADDYFHAPSDSLDRQVYAVRFCYNNRNTKDLTELMKRLEKDFGKPFELKVTAGTSESYYELDNSWNSSIVIDFCPAGVHKPDAVESGNFEEWTVNFCYGIKYSTIGCFVDYELAYNAQ